MNLRHILMGSVVAGALLAAPSCKKLEDFKDLNQNPNAATAPNTRALLSNVIARMGTDFGFDQGAGAGSNALSAANSGAALYSQLYSETQYTETSRYAIPTNNFDAYYSGPLYDLQNIINYNSNPETAALAAQNGSNKNQIAVARILKAHYFRFLTDNWGDIPYSGALKGEGNVTFDKQQAVYADLIKELKEAVDQFDNGDAFAGDLLFNGNISKWKKYANSLRALLALQMAKVNPTLGKTEFVAAITHPAGVIENNSDNVTVEYPGGSFPNPFYNYYNIIQRKDYAVSATVINRLTATNDPRINAYAESTTGFPYGLTREAATQFNNSSPNWSFVLADEWRAADAPYTIIGAGNIWLARAEAAQRGWTSDVAATAYSTGIQRSMEQWGVYGTSSFATYIAQGSVALTAGTELEKIATQEWLSWYPNGFESWNTWRRTGFPALVQAPGTTEGIPRRQPYGPTQYLVNNTNVKAAETQYTVGGRANSQFGRVWWDVQ